MAGILNDQKSVRQQFMDFLVANNAYDTFVVNMDSRVEWVLKHLKLNRPEDYITNAFDLKGSVGGKAYWENIDAKWQKQLTEFRVKSN